MGLYADCILPRLIHWVMSDTQFAEQREGLLKKIKGCVLEIGFGSGLNLPFYPEDLEKLYALDPITYGRQLAREQLSQCVFPIEFIDLIDGKYQLADNTVDVVVSTWTLCTIPNVEEALSEVKRVLKPSGTLYFMEHGRSPVEKIARWQDILTPFQKRFAGGCHLNRPIDQLITDAGFKIKDIENYFMKRPKFATYMYRGSAVYE